MPVPLKLVRTFLNVESTKPPIDVHLYPVLNPFNANEVLQTVAASFHASHCALSALLKGNVAPTPGGMLTKYVEFCTADVVLHPVGAPENPPYRVLASILQTKKDRSERKNRNIFILLLLKLFCNMSVENLEIMHGGSAPAPPSERGPAGGVWGDGSSPPRGCGGGAPGVKLDNCKSQAEKAAGLAAEVPAEGAAAAESEAAPAATDWGAVPAAEAEAAAEVGGRSSRCTAPAAGNLLLWRSSKRL